MLTIEDIHETACEKSLWKIEIIHQTKQLVLHCSMWYNVYLASQKTLHYQWHPTAMHAVVLTFTPDSTPVVLMLKSK